MENHFRVMCEDKKKLFKLKRIFIGGCKFNFCIFINCMTLLAICME